MNESHDFWCFSMTEFGISTHASPEGRVKGFPLLESGLEDPLKRFNQLSPSTLVTFTSGVTDFSASAEAGGSTGFSGSVVFTTFAAGFAAASSEDSLLSNRFLSDGLGRLDSPELALTSRDLRSVEFDASISQSTGTMAETEG